MCTHDKTLHCVQDYTAVIQSLPERDPPSYFGLPANIDRSSQRTNSAQVISQLRILKRSQSAGDKFDREAWSNELNPILALWKKLNQVHEETELLAMCMYISLALVPGYATKFLGLAILMNFEPSQN